LFFLVGAIHHHWHHDDVIVIITCTYVILLSSSPFVQKRKVYPKKEIPDQAKILHRFFPKGRTTGQRHHFVRKEKKERKKKKKKFVFFFFFLLDLFPSFLPSFPSPLSPLPFIHHSLTSRTRGHLEMGVSFNNFFSSFLSFICLLFYMGGKQTPAASLWEEKKEEKKKCYFSPFFLFFFLLSSLVASFPRTHSTSTSSLSSTPGLYQKKRKERKERKERRKEKKNHSKDFLDHSSFRPREGSFPPGSLRVRCHWLGVLHKGGHSHKLALSK